MKKNVKNSVIATSILVALAGSFMGCQQPITPSVDKDKVTNKDIYEQQITAPTMAVKSYFGKNVVEFSDVNYADSYLLYRFGPTGNIATPDKNVKGKLITDSPAEKFDGFVVEDVVASTNPMRAGTYTYKLIAKNSIKSARVVADLSGTAANQDYWANPNVDISYLPALASVSVTVSDTNMPKWGSKMPAPKALVEGVDYYRGTTQSVIGTTGDLNTFYFNPTLEVSTIYAVVEGLNDCFEYSTDNSTTTSYKVVATGTNGYTLTLPSTYTNYKLYAYNTWSTDNSYYLDSDKTLIKEGVPYQNDKKAIDVSWAQTKDDKDTKDKDESYVAKDGTKYQNVFKYTLNDNVPASNYKLVAQRAEITADPILNQYVTKVENVTLKEVGKVVNETAKTTTYAVIDETAKIGKKYRYFLGGTYGTTGRINSATFDYTYENDEQTKTVSDLAATLITKLPSETDLVRENVKGEIKFYIEGLYTDFAAKRVVKEYGVKTEKSINVTKTENLGKTYIHFEDTLDWNKNKTEALIPTYIFTYKKGYTTYTSEITLGADDTAPTKLAIWDVNDKSNTDKPKKVQVTKIVKNNDGDSGNDKADLVDGCRLLYKVTGFDINTTAKTKSNNTLVATYKLTAGQANNGIPNEVTLNKVAKNGGVDYKINYLVKDSTTGQTYKKGDVSVEEFGVEKTFEITGLDKNTSYDIVYTLYTMGFDKDGKAAAVNVTVDSGTNVKNDNGKITNLSTN